MAHEAVTSPAMVTVTRAFRYGGKSLKTNTGT